MLTKGEQTRENILKTAEALVMARGFSGTSLDEILKQVGITKGAFFHHFKSKRDLGRALIERFWRLDFQLFQDFAKRAEVLTDDPLQEVLMVLRLFEEFVESREEPLPGCLFASYVYEGAQFDVGVHDFIRNAFKSWAHVYEQKFEKLFEVKAPKQEVSPSDLAELIVATIEGGIVMGMSLKDKTIVARQSRQCRNYIQLLFAD
jgi:TetR/AcrR family transcriptional repressor of nem operon